MDINKILKEVDKYLPPQPSVCFSVSNEETGLFDCKIGGIPYFPKDMEYPRAKKNEFAGQPMVLLAQLNFEKIPPIPDFPTKGILQFFITPDDLYGMSEDFGDGMTKQDNFRVIYHENIITDTSKLLSENDIPKYSVNPEEDDEYYLPFSGTYKLTPHAAKKLHARLSDYRFEEIFVKCYNEFADEPIGELYELDEEIFESLCKTDYPVVFIGGYPEFTQQDPREEESISDCDVLLFEIESICDEEQNIEIMWGDMGTGTFMIPRDRLKALDFSRVLYNYDCY